MLEALRQARSKSLILFGIRPFPVARNLTASHYPRTPNMSTSAVFNFSRSRSALTLLPILDIYSSLN